MKLLRFGYVLPISLCSMFAFFLIVYATITWDNDDSSVWYGPNNPGYTDNRSSYTKDNNFDNATCPPKPPVPPSTGKDPGITGGVFPGGNGGTPSTPTTPVYSPPSPVTTSVSDGF